MTVPGWHLEEIPCPLCGGRASRRLGRRGNREHHGADPHAEPHAWTYVTRCARCDLLYANPMIRGMEHLERAYYGDPALYQATADGDPARMFGHRLDLIERLQPAGRLLDVGAGKGEFLSEARRRGWVVQGVEPSEPFCRYARATYGVDVHVGSLGSLKDLPEESFDVVSLNHVLEHVEAPRELLETCARYTRRGGLVFVEVPNTDSYLLRLVDLYFRAKGLDWSSRLSPVHPPFHAFGYTSRSLRFALERAGLRVETLSTYSGTDRGYRSGGGGSLAPRLRDVAAAALDRLGNRELLVAVARRPD